MSFWVAGVSRHRFLHALFTFGFRSLHVTGNASKHIHTLVIITVKADSFETPVITIEASRSCSVWQRSASQWESKRNKNATKIKSSNLCDWCFCFLTLKQSWLLVFWSKIKTYKKSKRMLTLIRQLIQNMLNLFSVKYFFQATNRQ